MMNLKKEIIIHSSFLLAYFAFITITNSWFEISYLPFWIGGFIGTLLPVIDQLIYVFLLSPEELRSKEISELIKKKEIKQALLMMVSTKAEGSKYIFHTAHFQLIFLVLTFLIITSSNSVMSIGLVLGFSLHLLIDQVTDYMQYKNIDSWFKLIPDLLDDLQKKWYIIFNIAILVIFAFFFL